jgi:V8-like Glu-specific endopeptidase
MLPWLALSALSARSSPPHTVAANAIAAVGALSGADVSSHHCTASIVNSPKGNVIVTAAHCAFGKQQLFFTPAYQDGHAPYGTWRVLSAYIYNEWRSQHDITNAGSPFDYAFLVVESHDGKSLEEVTGASLHLKTDIQPQPVVVAGYPDRSNSKYKDQLYTCDSQSDFEKQSWMHLLCDGIPNGFSGGPWIAAGSTDLVGLIGGYGQDLPDTDPNNYSVRFSTRVKQLFDMAANSVPPNPGDSNSNLGYQLGDGALLKHAELITSGYYTGGSSGGSRHMDMIVKWDDGEVTLYQGSTSTDPRKPFVGETQLAASGGLWKNAKSIAGVNVGGSKDGLVVRWIDGEMTLYQTVDQKGFHSEVQLLAPNSLWRDHAKLLAAGRYTSNGKKDDLIVTWSDGEVSLYSDIATNKLTHETQMAAPGSVWTHSETISGGSYTGFGVDDLLVRWSDGEFTLYSGVTPESFGAEFQIQPPNSLWTHATVISGGAFADNVMANDLIVRWSDGEVSHYPGVDTAGLHREIMLVSPSGSVPPLELITPKAP